MHFMAPKEVPNLVETLNTSLNLSFNYPKLHAFCAESCEQVERHLPSGHCTHTANNKHTSQLPTKNNTCPLTLHGQVQVQHKSRSPLPNVNHITVRYISDIQCPRDSKSMCTKEDNACTTLIPFTKRRYCLTLIPRRVKYSSPSKMGS